MTAMTKKQVLEENTQLRSACEGFRRQLADMALKLAELTVPKIVVYPLVDRLGRHYRMDGKTRCYPAQH